MNADGSYEQRHPPDGEPVIEAQAVLMEEARNAARNEDSRFNPSVSYDFDNDIFVRVNAEDPDATDGSIGTVEESDGDDTAGEAADDVGGTNAVETSVATADRLDAEGSDVGPNDAESGPRDGETDGQRSVGALDRFDEYWYRPESDTYEYAVRTPDGGRRYLKTESGAAAALERFYG